MIYVDATGADIFLRPIFFLVDRMMNQLKEKLVRCLSHELLYLRLYQCNLPVSLKDGLSLYIYIIYYYLSKIIADGRRRSKSIKAL